MKRMIHPHAEHELAQCATRFDHWRQCRTTPRARMPPWLWEHAVSFTAVWPITRVATRLRLRTRALKKRCGGAPVTAPCGALPMAFGLVEVPAASCFPSPPALALHTPDGARMRMHVHVPHALLATLVQAFLETP